MKIEIHDAKRKNIYYPNVPKQAPVDSQESAPAQLVHVAGWGNLIISRSGKDISVAMYDPKAKRSTWDGKIYPVAQRLLSVSENPPRPHALRKGFLGLGGKLSLRLLPG